MPTLIFDCETVPDWDAYARILGMAVTDGPSALAQAWAAAERPFKPALQQVVALAIAWIADDGTLQRLRALDGDEATMIQQWFHAVAHTHPVIAGWNTSGFDVPVLLTRALIHQIPVGDFYTVGQPYDGYLKRYSDRHHRDLMDLQAHFGATSRLSLDEMAALLGIPGKLDTHGNDVLSLYTAGDPDRIAAYCAHDVLTTAWVYARMAVHRGWWTGAQGDQFATSARAWVTTQPDPHWTPWVARAEAYHLW
jgi:predicted PolB exonuclease-like 3'-5' exonuclease